VFKKKTKGGGAMGVGVLYELYDYPFTYLLHRPDDRRAVVLVEDWMYARKSKHPRLRLYEERAVLVVLPFWIYPNKELLNRARKVLEIDAETTEKIFRYTEAYPETKLDEYCISKMRELAGENTAGIFQLLEEAENAYT
jgi:hypothetical protein